MSIREKTAVKTFSLLLATIGLYLLFWQLLSSVLSLPVYYYGRLIECLGLGLFVALVLSTPMRFEEMGIITDKKTMLCSLSLGGAVALAAFGGCAALSALKGLSLSFSFRFQEDFSQVTYFFVVPIQEILAKSVMYYSLELCLGREHPHRVNLLSALIFGVFHAAYGPEMMLLSMALTLLTGWLFRRFRCVWGCALAHFAFGFFPVCFGL